jgi:hypothetical protein
MTWKRDRIPAAMGHGMCVDVRGWHHLAVPAEMIGTERRGE